MFTAFNNVHFDSVAMLFDSGTFIVNGSAMEHHYFCSFIYPKLGYPTYGRQFSQPT